MGEDEEIEWRLVGKKQARGQPTQKMNPGWGMWGEDEEYRWLVGRKQAGDDQLMEIKTEGG